MSARILDDYTYTYSNHNLTSLNYLLHHKMSQVFTIEQTQTQTQTQHQHGHNHNHADNDQAKQQQQQQQHSELAKRAIRLFGLVYYSTPFYVMTSAEAVCTYITMCLLGIIGFIVTTHYVLPWCGSILQVLIHTHHSQRLIAGCLNLLNGKLKIVSSSFRDLDLDGGSGSGSGSFKFTDSCLELINVLFVGVSRLTAVSAGSGSDSGSGSGSVSGSVSSLAVEMVNSMYSNFTSSQQGL
ncbi:unnamed protein product [Ambrosiozyma monospora]|uniref:Unnamed protein product n=1 Tax=Ambrosiozyma monospora TaxID=43982 RepID=A0A9W6Z3M8_AMBMO|nr:unnamed protein product [Ambrosiozyma monospora]